MSDSAKKQSFLHGTMLLAMATAIVKVIGALYKIPLNAIIGAQGFGYFNTAYEIYNVLLMILGCRWLATVLEQPDAWFAILCLCPCALLMGFMSTFRGFFQGQENMRPTSNSQMLEAVIKLILGLAAAYALMEMTHQVSFAAGGAILGVTVSCLVSAIFLYSQFRPAYRALPHSEETPSSAKATAKELLAIAIPITIGSAGLQLLTVVETGIYMERLVMLIETNQYTLPLVDTVKAGLMADNPALTAAQLHTQTAATFKGIFNFAQTIFNMPCAFIVPITVSVLPAITAQLTLKEDAQVRDTEESAARVTGLLSMPCSVGLCILARPIMSLLGGYSGEKLDLAAQLMMLLGSSVFLYSIIQYTNAVLQSHGKAHVPVVNMLLAGGAKLVVVYFLAGNPSLGILGVPIGTLLCYATIAVLNLLCIRKLIPQKPRLLLNLLRPLPAAVIMGIVVFFAYQGLVALMGQDGSRIILCGAPIAVGAAVYFVCVILTKAIGRKDCLLLPGGQKIADLLHL